MSRKTILIVDDEEAIRDMLSTALAMKDYPVMTAKNGQEALQLLEAGLRPGMILLDYMMPIMNGKTFVETVKKRKEFSDIAIILTTAYPQQFEAYRDTIRLIEKPFDLNVILDAAKSYCG